MTTVVNAKKKVKIAKPPNKDRPGRLEAREGSDSGDQVLCLGNVQVQKESGRVGPDTRHGLKEPVLAHHPMRRERLEVCNMAAGSSAAEQRCAGSRARMSDQKAGNAGAQHVSRFATRLLLRVALLLSLSCTGSVVGVAPTGRSKLRPWYAWPEINPFQKDKPPASFMITTHNVGDGAVWALGQLDPGNTLNVAASARLKVIEAILLPGEAD